MSETQQRILIVDDESSIRHALRVTLGAMGFAVGEAGTGEEALALIARSRYDAVLLDMNMPGMGGMRACAAIRGAAPHTAIVMLTVRDDAEDKIDALDAGADDYVTKPFHMRELAARVRAVVRRVDRARPDNAEETRQTGIVVDRESRAVYKNGSRIHLTPTEFDLLDLLVANAGKPLAHAQLLRAVWGPEYSGEIEYLRTFIRQLRRKLEDDPAHPTRILTDSWFGYRFS